MKQLNRLMVRKNFKQYLILILIILLSLLVRLFLLDKIPAEMWGDVNEHFAFAENILKGSYIKEFWAGDGPIFSYFAAVVFKIFGHSFFSLKLMTVFIGVLSVYLMYLFTRQLSKNNLTAYISSFLMSVSFWSISFSRQGKPYILVSLMVLLTLYFALKKKWILAGLFLGLGMYTQAAFWGMILFSFINLQMLVVSLLVSGPLIYQVIFSKTNYFNSSASYLGEKFAFKMPLFQKIYIIFENYYKNIQAFWIGGDTTFRHNISGYPHLDILSGVFLIIGIALVLKEIIYKKNKNLIIFLILPFFLAQAASTMDVNNPLNTPAMGRTVGIIPIVFFIISYAITNIYNFLLNRKKKPISLVFLIISLMIIFFINIYNYFIVYPKGLPNHNTPFGKIIANDIDSSSSNKQSVLVGCCWGDWGQPELKSVTNRISSNKQMVYVEKNDFSVNSCQEFTDKNKELVIYSDPSDKNLLFQISQCLKNPQVSTIVSNGYNVAAKSYGLIK